MNKIIRVACDQSEFAQKAETALIGFKVISCSHQSTTYNKTIATPKAFDHQVWRYTSYTSSTQSTWIDAMFVVEVSRDKMSTGQSYDAFPHRY